MNIYYDLYMVSSGIETQDLFVQVKCAVVVESAGEALLVVLLSIAFEVLFGKPSGQLYLINVGSEWVLFG